MSRSLLAIGGVAASAFVLTSISLAEDAPASLAAPQASLFGIALGAPLTLPACPMLRNWLSSIQSVDKQRMTTMCTVPLLPPVVGEEGVIFSPDNSPTWIKTISVALIVGVDADGVQTILMQTQGIARQEEIEALLEDKFGEPKSLEIVQKSNRLGATFGVIESEWLVGTSTVTFSGADDDFDTGSIFAISAKKIDQITVEMAQKKAAGAHL